MDIKGHYLYDLTTSKIIGVKDEDAVYTKMKNKAICVNDGSGQWDDKNRSADFIILGDDYSVYNACKSGEIKYGTIQDLSFSQIVELFMQGNMTKEELQIGLECKEATGITITDDGQTTRAVFTYMGKQYELNCSSEAAKSQIDDIVVNDYTNNISVSTGCRVYENYTGTDRYNWGSHDGMYFTEGGIYGGTGYDMFYASHCFSDPQQAYDIEGKYYQAISDEFGIPLYDFSKLSDEQVAYINANPSKYHIHIAPYNDPGLGYSLTVDSNGFRNSYIDDIVVKEQVDTLKNTGNWISPEEWYYYNIKTFKSEIENLEFLKEFKFDYYPAWEAIYSVELEGNNVKFTDKIVDCIMQKIDVLKNSNEYQSKEQRASLAVFGITQNDTRESVIEKIQKFCRSVDPSSDGFTLHIEDYYAVLNSTIGKGMTYNQIVADCNKFLTEVNQKAAQEAALYAQIEGTETAETTNSPVPNLTGEINNDNPSTATGVLSSSKQDRAITSESELVQSWLDNYVVTGSDGARGILSVFYAMCQNGFRCNNFDGYDFYYEYNGNNFEELSSLVSTLRYDNWDDSTAVTDFSYQFVQRVRQILEEKSGISTKDLDSGVGSADIQKAFVKILEEIGAKEGVDDSTLKSAKTYTDINFDALINYFMEYDSVPYQSKMFGTQFNSLKEEIEHYEEIGGNIYNVPVNSDNMSTFWDEVYNSYRGNHELFAGQDYYSIQFFDNHNLGAYNDLWIPKYSQGLITSDDLIDAQIEGYVYLLQGMNNGIGNCKNYGPCVYSQYQPDRPPYFRVGIDGQNYITITDDSMQCVKLYLDTLAEKGIDCANDEYCTLFGFTKDDDLSTIKAKMNNYYQNIEGATQDDNGNYKVPLRNYYVQLCNEEISAGDVDNQGSGGQALRIRPMSQMEAIVDAQNYLRSVQTQIADYGFNINDVYQLGFGYGGHMAVDENKLLTLTAENIRDALTGEATNPNENVIAALQKAANALGGVENLINQWCKDDCITPEELLARLTGTHPSGGACYVQQNRYSQEFIEYFANCKHKYSTDDLFIKQSDGTYIVRPLSITATSSTNWTGMLNTIHNDYSEFINQNKYSEEADIDTSSNITTSQTTVSTTPEPVAAVTSIESDDIQNVTPTSHRAPQLNLGAFEDDIDNTSLNIDGSGVFAKYKDSIDIEKVWHDLCSENPPCTVDIYSSKDGVPSSYSNAAWSFSINDTIDYELFSFMGNYFGIEYDGPVDLTKLVTYIGEQLTEEQEQFVIDNPQIFHFNENSQLSGEYPSWGYDNYVESIKSNLQERMSADEWYTSSVLQFQRFLPTGENDEFLRLYRSSMSDKNPAYWVKSDVNNNTVEFTDETIQKFMEYIHSNPSGSSPIGDHERFLSTFGFSKNDDEAAVRAKIEAFCSANGSSDGKTIDIESYYLAVKEMTGYHSYEECVKLTNEYNSKENAAYEYASGEYDVFGNGYAPSDNSLPDTSWLNNAITRNTKASTDINVKNTVSADSAVVTNITDSKINEVKNKFVEEFLLDIERADGSMPGFPDDDRLKYPDYSSRPPIYAVDVDADGNVVFGDKFKEHLKEHLQYNINYIKDWYNEYLNGNKGAIAYGENIKTDLLRMLGFPEDVMYYGKKDPRKCLDNLQSYIDNPEKLDKLISDFCTSLGSTDGKTVTAEQYYDTLANNGISWASTSTDKDYFYTDNEITTITEMYDLIEQIGTSIPEDKNYWESHITYLAENKEHSYYVNLLNNRITEGNPEGFEPLFILAAGINDTDSNSVKQEKLSVLLEKIGVQNAEYRGGSLSGGSVDVTDIIKYLLGNNKEKVNYFATLSAQQKEQTEQLIMSQKNNGIQTVNNTKDSIKNKTESKEPEYTELTTPADYKNEAKNHVDELQKKVGNVIYDNGIYYNTFNSKRYNYIWDLYDEKWQTFDSDEVKNANANGKTDKTLTRIQMIRAALKAGLTFTANPKICVDGDGNKYYFDETSGNFVKDTELAN